MDEVRYKLETSFTFRFLPTVFLQERLQALNDRLKCIRRLGSMAAANWCFTSLRKARMNISARTLPRLLTLRICSRGSSGNSAPTPSGSGQSQRVGDGFWRGLTSCSAPVTSGDILGESAVRGAGTRI